jgi:hypothetical protein
MGVGVAQAVARTKVRASALSLPHRTVRVLAKGRVLRALRCGVFILLPYRV